MTAGQNLTAELRTWLRIGPRTRWYRKDRGITLTTDRVIERIWETIALYPGIESEARTAALKPAHAAMCAWFKHVNGYRIDPMVRREITEQSPWKFTEYLGRMVDSGCTNSGQFEVWFAAQRPQLVNA
jgi:hypothetical protein